MKVHGTGTVHAPADAVWAALGDAGVLARAVPGLDQIDFARDGTCRFTLTTAIAAVRGSYTGEASVVERPEPHVRGLRVSATGVKGKVAGDVTIRAIPAGEGATELSYVADADVDGAIAGIGQRMLASVAKRVAADAIAGLDAALAGAPPTAAAPAAHSLPADGPPAAAPAAQEPPAEAPGARTGQAARAQDDVPRQAAIERARREIGLRGERLPAAGRPGPAVRIGLAAGAGAAVGAIVVGALIRKRRGRR